MSKTGKSQTLEIVQCRALIRITQYVMSRLLLLLQILAAAAAAAADAPGALMRFHGNALACERLGEAATSDTSGMTVTT